jgi:hypothetical protein
VKTTDATGHSGTAQRDLPKLFTSDCLIHFSSSEKNAHRHGSPGSPSRKAQNRCEQLGNNREQVIHNSLSRSFSAETGSINRLKPPDKW